MKRYKINKRDHRNLLLGLGLGAGLLATVTVGTAIIVSNLQRAKVSKTTITTNQNESTTNPNETSTNPSEPINQKNKEVSSIETKVRELKAKFDEKISEVAKGKIKVDNLGTDTTKTLFKKFTEYRNKVNSAFEEAYAFEKNRATTEEERNNIDTTFNYYRELIDYGLTIYDESSLGANDKVEKDYVKSAIKRDLMLEKLPAFLGLIVLGLEKGRLSEEGHKAWTALWLKHNRDDEATAQSPEGKLLLEANSLDVTELDRMVSLLIRAGADSSLKLKPEAVWAIDTYRMLENYQSFDIMVKDLNDYTQKGYKINSEDLSTLKEIAENIEKSINRLTDDIQTIDFVDIESRFFNFMIGEIEEMISNLKEKIDKYKIERDNDKTSYYQLEYLFHDFNRTIGGFLGYDIPEAVSEAETK